MDGLDSDGGHQSAIDIRVGDQGALISSVHRIQQEHIVGILFIEKPQVNGRHLPSDLILNQLSLDLCLYLLVSPCVSH